MFRKFWIGIIFLGLGVLPIGAETLWLGITTTLDDSGFGAFLEEEFESDTGHDLRVVVAASGHIMDIAKNKGVDILITHAPEYEEAFIKEGYALTRTPIMASHFILVGPIDDPAQAAGKNISQALQMIYESHLMFVSRQDGSGIYLHERALIEAAALPLEGWFIVTGQGMGSSLNIANAKSAYILAEEVSFARFENKANLKIIVREGLAENVYSILTLPHPRNLVLAQIFKSWLEQNQGDLLEKYKEKSNGVGFAAL